MAIIPVDSNAEVVCPRLFDRLPTNNEARGSFTAKVFEGLIPLYGRSWAFVKAANLDDECIIVALTSMHGQSEEWFFLLYRDTFSMTLSKNMKGDREGELILVPRTKVSYEGFGEEWNGPRVHFQLNPGIRPQSEVIKAGDIDLSRSSLAGDTFLAMNTPEKALTLATTLAAALRVSMLLMTKVARELDEHRILSYTTPQAHTQAWL